MRIFFYKQPSKSENHFEIFYMVSNKNIEIHKTKNKYNNDHTQRNKRKQKEEANVKKEKR